MIAPVSDAPLPLPAVPAAPEQPVKQEEMAALDVDSSGHGEYLQHGNGNASASAAAAAPQVSAGPAGPPPPLPRVTRCERARAPVPPPPLPVRASARSPAAVPR